MNGGVRRWTHGPSFEEDGVRFRLWAPAQKRLALALESRGAAIPMERRDGDFFEVFVERIGAGDLYRFQLCDGTRVPDPASRFQPQDVHGPSETVDHEAYRWRENWRGRAWDDVVLYELHIGAFTPEGSFASAAHKLDHLVDLGATAVEIMPLADFRGRWGWGYDGVCPYAPDASYGRPEDFKAFVEAAHRRGIAVLLDVVYNHFGPEGNYLSSYAPHFFTDRHRTPWGDAINFDGSDARPVRDFVIENAEYWVDAFHLDGLRLDAVHSIKDDTRPDIIDELAERLRSRFERPIHLLLENERNEPGASSGAAASPSSTRRSGTTTSTTCCTSPRRTSKAAIMPTTARRSSLAGRWRRASRFRARSRPIAGRRAAGRAQTFLPALSSRSFRTTTRSATAHSASG